jgi:hypothetical protein
LLLVLFVTLFAGITGEPPFETSVGTFFLFVSFHHFSVLIRQYSSFFSCSVTAQSSVQPLSHNKNSVSFAILIALHTQQIDKLTPHFCFANCCLSFFHMFKQFTPFIVTAMLPTVISGTWRGVDSEKLTRDEQVWLSTTYVQVYAFLSMAWQQIRCQGTDNAWAVKAPTWPLFAVFVGEFLAIVGALVWVRLVIYNRIILYLIYTVAYILFAWCKRSLLCTAYCRSTPHTHSMQDV